MAAEYAARGGVLEGYAQAAAQVVHADPTESADALVGLWPEIESDRELSSSLRANAAALRARAEDAQRPGQPGVLRARRNLAAWREQLVGLLAHAEERLGVDRPHSRAIRETLSWLTGVRERLGGAAVRVVDLRRGAV